MPIEPAVSSDVMRRWLAASSCSTSQRPINVGAERDAARFSGRGKNSAPSFGAMLASPPRRHSADTFFILLSQRDERLVAAEDQTPLASSYRLAFIPVGDGPLIHRASHSRTWL